MAYVTPADVCRWYGYREMAELAGQDDVDPIDANLLREVVDGYASGVWTADQVDAANQAVIRIDNALNDASRLADSYLVVTQAMPLLTDAITASVLPRMVGDIARYTLHGSKNIEAVTARYNAALAWLKDVATGKAGFGGSSQIPPGGVGMAIMTSAPNVFGGSFR